MAENIVRLLREKDLSYIEIKRLLRLSDEELTKVKGITKSLASSLTSSL